MKSTSELFGDQQITAICHQIEIALKQSLNEWTDQVQKLTEDLQSRVISKEIRKGA